MRIKPSAILLVLLACLYCYGGSGFYIIDFCCNSCKIKGVEHVLADDCHQEESHDDACCQNDHETASETLDAVICHPHCNHFHHCSIKSYKFDLNSTAYKFRNFVPVIDLSCLPLKILPNSIISSFKEIYKLEIPPLLYSSRDILTKKSVLLI